MAMMYHLQLLGPSVNQHGAVANNLVIHQHELGGSITDIADMINYYAQSGEECGKLPAWLPGEQKGPRFYQ